MFVDPEGNSLIATIIIGVLVGAATKYTEDVIYNIVIGEKGWDIFVPSSSWGEYIAAGMIGGITGGIGNYISAATSSVKIGLTALKYSVDILGRPLLNQTFELTIGERQNFDLSKYGMDVIYRGISSFTDFIPMPKPKGNFFMKLGMTYYKSVPKVIARSGFRIGKYYGFLPRTLGQ